jgi:hypothetical protein
MPKRASDRQASKQATASMKPKPAQHKAQRTAPVARQRVRHNEDEDYVAKDTYVYYGNRRSR